MRAAVHTHVPSSTLLKFLKSQSEGICFFSPNPRPGFIFDYAAPRGAVIRSQILKSHSKPSARCLSTTTARRATVEAGFVNLDFLWPQAANKPLQPQSSQSRSQARLKKHSYESFPPARRAASGWHYWRERCWGRMKKTPKPLQPDDLPNTFYPREESGDFIFSLGQHISAKAAAQHSKLRCTELDENGNVVMASGEFKKSELIAKVQYLTHPLGRFLNTSTVWPPPARSSKDRLQSPPPYPSPPILDSDQPPPSPSPNQSEPRAHIRCLWFHRFLQSVRIYI